MIRSRKNKPSPLAGEGGARSAPGEGVKLRLSHAKKMRAAMADAERKLWLALRDRRLKMKFRRQVPVGPFIADFLSYEHRLVVEVDGGQHEGSKRDSARDRWFATNSFKVLRFWNNDVLANLDGVLQTIVTAIDVASPHPARAARGHPSPARGEGKREPAR